MEGADDSAGQEDRGREERSLGCGANLDQFEPREKEADDDSGEHFKEAFNPEMNYPPAPVFSGDEMAALSVHQSSGVEERDGNAGDEEEDQKRAVFALANQSRLESCDHQDKPENETDEQKYLPEAAEVDVFITLAAEPEPHVAEPLLDAQPFAGEGPADNEDRARRRGR